MKNNLSTMFCTTEFKTFEIEIQKLDKSSISI